MWTCNVCAQQIEAEEPFCYHCGADRDISAEDAARISRRRSQPGAVACLRCGTAMRYAGLRRFHEGSRGWGFWLGDLGELFTHREHYDTYVCTRCGKLEFFADGIGEDHRVEE